jgi:SAM-dependent methyltransferase
VNYKLAYAIGFHPWEDAAADPPFVEKIAEILDRERNGSEPPFGPALDLGTGSGIWAIELARRGWEVTGVDDVDRALDRARERVEAADVPVRLVHGDVTALQDAHVGGGYRLLLDTGTFHGLTSEQRDAMGRAVTAVAAPDATLLLLVWPRRRRPLIRGADRDEVEAAFPEWTITDVQPSHFSLPKPMELILRPDEEWYRLRRAST